MDVSIFPGTTVVISHSSLGEDILLDTPGIYGVSSFNDEGMVARDVILQADIVINAAGLNALPMEAGQTLVALVAITLLVPCIASILVILKERGLKDGLLIWPGSFIIAFCVGGMLARVIGI